MVQMKFQEWSETVKSGKFLEEKDMKQLCELVSSYLLEESNVVPVEAPVTICGDIHGQLFDLLELFKIAGELPFKRFVFLGDYVDRGHHSLETITYLLLLKAQFPHCITMLRGNHESRTISMHYGFLQEVDEKYGNTRVWDYCMRVFDLLPLSACIENKIFCVHGGISPDVSSLDQLRTIDRRQDVPSEGAFADLLWSDPEDLIQNWAPSPRGAGYIFGENALDQFLHENGMEFLTRSHQLVDQGYQYHFSKNQMATIWSCPNYMYRCGNVAAVLELDASLNRNFKIFREAERQGEQTNSRVVPHYFL